MTSRVREGAAWLAAGVSSVVKALGGEVAEGDVVFASLAGTDAALAALALRTVSRTARQNHE
jgi:hypothetical protein